MPPLPEAISALTNASRPKIGQLAYRLAWHLNDDGSVMFYAKHLGRAARGEIPVAQVLDAYRVADRARGGARRPGAIFKTALDDWCPEPKPSQINRPAYHVAPAPGSAAPPGPPTPEEIVEARRQLGEARIGPIRRLWQSWFTSRGIDPAGEPG